ncbi:MAG TPA: SpoIIE family protein phosphatase [Thermoanaerobaculia bacterium]|jgi:sigma-B regulation protein RsbU (phosphoserine phosphatase)|nr:SpoIIE family protein phosphatase [Thermoanaerobaculia bacterium]
MEGTPRAVPATQAWDELLTLARDEAGERPMLERLLDLWRREHGADAAGLYLERGGALQQETAVGSHLPATISSESDPGDGLGSLTFPGGRLLFIPAGAVDGAASDPLTLLLAAALRSSRLKQDLKEQQFQVNYRVVELEALYDVGLAVASTLDLDRLSEEILMRAVSLLDARRGALYILEDGRYRLDRIFGGEAAPWFAAADPELRLFLTGGGEAPANLLPGARHLLGVPIEVENGPRGLIAAGDKESRRGVGPFLASDRRTLSLFANQAALALENARLHLQALEKERLEREMHLAAEIQRQILPKGVPLVPGYELIGWYRPARQVGGDYYDLFRSADGKVGLVVGDVTGKGMPAALMVSTLHSALRLLLDQTGFVPAMLERLSRHIGESSAANKFITMLVAELSPETGVLHYMNAGHNPGILLHAGGAVEPLSPGGTPLGLIAGARYKSSAVTLGAGDLVCIYSDGITEAAAPDDEEFGMERLIDLLRVGRELPLPELIAAITHAVGEFSQGLPQGDDQTLILLRRQ